MKRYKLTRVSRKIYKDLLQPYIEEYFRRFNNASDVYFLTASPMVSYKFKYAIIDGCLIICRARKHFGKALLHVYNYPISLNSDKEKENKIFNELIELGFSFLLEKAFLNKVKVDTINTRWTINDDFIFSNHTIIDMKGKKFKNHRSSCNQFDKKFSGVVKFDNTLKYDKDYRLINEAYCGAKGDKKNEALSVEKRVVKVLHSYLDLFNASKHYAISLWIDDKMFGYGIVEKLTDTRYSIIQLMRNYNIDGYSSMNTTFVIMRYLMLNNPFIKNQDTKILYNMGYTGQDNKLRKHKSILVPDYITQIYLINQTGETFMDVGIFEKMITFGSW